MSERLAYGDGDGAAFGLLEDQSPVTLIPDSIEPGALVLADVLMRLTQNYGSEVAFIVDELNGPCESCARNTYGGGKCVECEARDTIGPLVDEQTTEQAGAFSPRCD